MYNFTKKQEELKELEAVERNLNDAIHANKYRLQSATGKAREYMKDR